VCVCVCVWLGCGLNLYGLRDFSSETKRNTGWWSRKSYLLKTFLQL